MSSRSLPGPHDPSQTCGRSYRSLLDLWEVLSDLQEVLTDLRKVFLTPPVSAGGPPGPAGSLPNPSCTSEGFPYTSRTCERSS